VDGVGGEGGGGGGYDWNYIRVRSLSNPETRIGLYILTRVSVCVCLSVFLRVCV